MRSPVNRHRLWQVAVDAALVAAAWVLSWYVRFEGRLRPRYYDRYLEWDVVVLVVGVMLPVFIAFGFYNRWWRYVSTQDMWGVLRGVTVAVIAAFLVFTLLDFHPASVPRGIWIVDLLLLLASSWACVPLRADAHRAPIRAVDRRARWKEVLIVGAGEAAQLILREMCRNPSLGYTSIGLVDDDPRKNLRLHVVRVLGTTAELPELLRERRPDELLLIVIPSARATRASGSSSAPGPKASP